MAQALGFKVEWDGDNETVKIDNTFEEDFKDKYEVAVVEGKCEDKIDTCSVLEQNKDGNYEVSENSEYYFYVYDKDSKDLKTFSKYLSFYDDIKDDVEQVGEEEPYTYTISPFQITSNKLILLKTNSANTLNNKDADNETSKDDIKNDDENATEDNDDKDTSDDNVKNATTNDNSDKDEDTSSIESEEDETDNNEDITVDEEEETNTTKNDENKINIAGIVIFRIDQKDENYKKENFNSGSYPFVVNLPFVKK